MGEESEDILIVRQLREGREAAFHALFKKYFGALTIFSNKIVKDEDVARDIVQGVFTRIYEQRSTLEIQVSLKAFLYQSVRNRSLNELKSRQIKQRHHDIILQQSSGDIATDDSLIEEAEMEDRIVEAIGALPNQCKRIFEMSRFDGLSNSEIADTLSLSKRTVETQISKALKTLRSQLADLLPAVAAGLVFLWFFK
jgi:RNA polymerase sigma-70 factor (ECF subfamily)